MNKKADIIRVYLPPDANTLLSVTDHCLRSRHYVNVIVAGKQPAPQWLDMDAAIKHCTAGLGIWEWASNDEGSDPDVVMACAGDVPTLETLAAVEMLRQHFPELKIRVINVVDLMALQPQSEHPHGLSDKDFDVLFTKDKPIIFAYHGYPSLIHQLTYRRTNHHNLHVRGYKEEGTTTTPFDMAVRNDIDRFHLVKDVVDRVPSLGPRAAYLTQIIRDKLIDHKRYIRQHGEDMPAGWKSATGAGVHDGPQTAQRNEPGAADGLPRAPRRNRVDADSTAYRPYRSSAERARRTPGARGRGAPHRTALRSHSLESAAARPPHGRACDASRFGRG